MLWFLDSCQKSELVPKTNSSSENNQTNSSTLRQGSITYDGETLFRGIYFAEGEVAEKIPEIYSLNVRNLIDDTVLVNECIAFQNQIVAKIANDHPSFFNDFQVAIQSGNHLTVKNKLDETAVILNNTVTNLIGFQITQQILNDAQQYTDGFTDNFSPNPNNKGNEISAEIIKIINSSDPQDIHRDLCVIAVVVLVAAAVVVLVIAVVSVAVIAFEVAVVAERTQPGKGLLQERLINSIAVNFRV